MSEEQKLNNILLQKFKFGRNASEATQNAIKAQKDGTPSDHTCRWIENIN